MAHGHFAAHPLHNANTLGVTDIQQFRFDVAKRAFIGTLEEVATDARGSIPLTSSSRVPIPFGEFMYADTAEALFEQINSNDALSPIEREQNDIFEHSQIPT